MDDERDELDPDDELMTFTADELRERSGELSEVFDAWLRAIADDMEALDDERVVLKFFPIPEGVSGFDPATIRSRDHFVWSLGEHFAAVLAIPDPVERIAELLGPGFARTVVQERLREGGELHAEVEDPPDYEDRVSRAARAALHTYYGIEGIAIEPEPEPPSPGPARREEPSRIPSFAGLLRQRRARPSVGRRADEPPERRP